MAVCECRRPIEVLILCYTHAQAATFDRMGPHLAAAGIRLVSIDFPGTYGETWNGWCWHQARHITCLTQQSHRARHVDAPVPGRRLPLHRLCNSSSHVSICRCMSALRRDDPMTQLTTYPKRQVYYALAVSRKLGWKKFSILGHSLGAFPDLAHSALLYSTHTLTHICTHKTGAAIGIALAGSYPEVVQRVVTVEALGLVSRPAETAPQVLRCVRAHMIVCVSERHAFTSFSSVGRPACSRPLTQHLSTCRCC